jgi:hypothetical protein
VSFSLYISKTTSTKAHLANREISGLRNNLEKKRISGVQRFLLTAHTFNSKPFFPAANSKLSIDKKNKNRDQNNRNRLASSLI